MTGKRSARTTAAPTTAGQALVDEARAALRRLAEESPVGQVAYATIEEIERTWDLTPLTIGLAGAAAGRLALIDVICGGTLDGLARNPACPPVSVVRGDAARFHARHADGSVEHETMPPRRPTLETRVMLALHDRVAAARTARAERAAAAERADQALPALIRTTPPWWAVWLRVIRWVWVKLRRRELAARDLALAAVADATREVEQADHELAAADQRMRDPVQTYLDRLHALARGGVNGVVALGLEVPTGPLPTGVVVVELPDATVDALIEVDGEQVATSGVDGAAPRRLGGLVEAASALAAVATDSRAARLGRLTIEAIRAGLSSIVEMLDGVEADYRARVARLESMRITDRAAFIAAQLARVRPQINASVGAVVEHAHAHLGSELAQVESSASARIKAATSADELKAAIAAIDTDSAAAMVRIAEEVRILAAGGIGGSAHDLYPIVIGELAAHGLPDDRVRGRAAPVLPPIAVLPGLVATTGTKLGSAGWLAGLFRSLDRRRTDVTARLTARAAHLREVARAELLDTEPRLAAVLADALAAGLAAAIDEQAAWLAAAFEDEGHAIERDRLQLAPLIHARDVARDDTRRLTEMTVSLEL